MADRTIDSIEAARDALDRHAWGEAFEILAEADRAGSLPADGLRMLAEAAWWSAHPDAVLEVLERAYQAYLKEGDRGQAAMMAYRLAEQYGMRMAMPMAGGWMANAEQMVADDPDAPVHGYLAWMQGLVASVTTGDLDQAIAHYDRSLEFAARTGNRSLHGKSLHD